MISPALLARAITDPAIWAELDAAAQALINRNKLADYKPYPKQAEFHKLGADNDEALLMAGNQTLKTFGISREVAMHLTGKYPDWWEGRRFTRPIRAIAGSESSELTRKGVQRLLLGTPEDETAWGTGAIPGEDIVSWTRKQGVPNTVDNIVVKHYDERGVHDGNSTVQFSSYDQGASKWSADTVDLVWFDEEPPEAVYMEGISRTNATHGYAVTSLYPGLGMSAVVRRFYPKPQFARCAFVIAGVNDALHYTPEERARIIAKYPKHERDARAHGIPQFGSGLVFSQIKEADITCEPFAIPKHFARLVGGDFGWEHPAGWVWFAHDRDTDIVYITDVYRCKETLIPIQASAIKGRGAWIPVAWPHDGYQVRDGMTGEQTAEQYRKEGVNMRPEHAHFEETPAVGETKLSRISTEAGITEMMTRQATGRLKVFSTCVEWFEEWRQYHRKNGLLVKEQDDLMSATRIGIMDLRYAIVEPAARGAIDHNRRSPAWV